MMVGLAGQVEGADQAVVIDGGDGDLVALILGLAGDIADRAVGVMGQHGDLLLRLAVHARAAAGHDRQLLQASGPWRRRPACPARSSGAGC